MSQELRVDITGNAKGLQKATKQAEKTIGGLDKSLGNIAKSIAGVFAAREIINFGKEAVMLAARIEGVEKAFKSLDGVSLAGLRNATKGTVTDMRLMQSAVQARNFKIPLEQLGGFFEFATQRASETGESVDHLVNSIITGIGRKSPLILDNLGISAIELRKRLRGVGLESASVADIAGAMNEIIADQQREFGSLGDAALTSQQKLDKMGATWQNLKTSFGEAIISTGVVDQMTTAFDEIANSFNNEAIANKLGINLIKFRRDFYKQLMDETGNLDGAHQKLTERLSKMDEEYMANQKAMMTVVDEQSELLHGTKNQTSATDEASQSTEEFTKIMDSFNKKMSVFNAEWALFGENDPEGKMNAVKAAMVSLTIEGTQPALKKVEELRQRLAQLQQQVDTKSGTQTGVSGVQKLPITTPLKARPDGQMSTPDVPGQIEKATNGMQQFQEMSQLVGFTWENLGVQFSQVFTGMLENGTLTFRGLMVALIKMITKLTVALITATALRTAMGDASAAPRAMSAAAAVASGVGALAAAGIPAMADGGVVSSPTLALIGEGRESEAVIPLSKLDAMMSNSGGGGVGQVVLRGQDLILAYDRARGFKTRISG